MNNEYLFFVGIRSRRKGQRGRGGRLFAQICAKNAKCTATIGRAWFGETAPKSGQWEGLLLLHPLILLYRFGGDGSGGFGGVGGLHVGGGCRDRPQRLAGRDTDGEGDQEERHDD